MKPPNTFCATCGSPIYRAPSHIARASRHYCTPDCQIKSQTQKVEGVCEGCGSSFMAPPSQANRRRFCSQACKWDWQASIKGKLHPQFAGVERTCPQCGQSFHTTKFTVAKGKGRFCQLDCYRAYKANPPEERICEQCEQPFVRAVSQMKGSRGRFCSMECSATWYSGPNSPAWKGGRSSYRGPNWKHQRKEARQRDNHQCQRCGTVRAEGMRNFSVHHIRPFRTFGYVRGENDNYLQANDLSNLITLCPSCHGKEERKAQND